MGDSPDLKPRKFLSLCSVSAEVPWGNIAVITLSKEALDLIARRRKSFLQLERQDNKLLTTRYLCAYEATYYQYDSDKLEEQLGPAQFDKLQDNRIVEVPLDYNMPEEGTEEDRTELDVMEIRDTSVNWCAIIKHSDVTTETEHVQYTDLFGDSL